jgi:hypothetical protein
MKRMIVPLVLAALLASLLAACGLGKVYRAYTAAGDGTHPEELRKTTLFKADDDLNVVVTLGAHNNSAPVYAIFASPTGALYQTDPITAERTSGRVLLGLDWEAQGQGIWPAGDWRVEIYVDNRRQETLHFTVEATIIPTPNG